MQTTSQLELLYAVGSQVPKNVKSIGKLLSRLPKDSSSTSLLQLIIDECIAYLMRDGKTINKGQFEQAKAIARQNGALTAAEFEQLFAGLFSLIKALLRVPVASAFKSPAISSKLLSDELRIDEAQCQMIVDSALRSRPSSALAAWKISPQLSGFVTRPRLKSIDWRIDVAISSSIINRIMEPTIVIHLTLQPSNSTTEDIDITFETSLAQFSKLRFTVARMLSEFHAVESKPLLAQPHRR